MTHQTKKRSSDKALRVVQISDSHLSKQATAVYRGENADQGLQSLLPGISAWGPDIILATGDLSEDASVESYQRLKHYFESLVVPVYVLPGNHDDVSLMKGYFDNGPWHGPLLTNVGDWQWVLFNTARPGRIDGVISQDDIEVVRRQLESDSNRPVLLALHHQPVAVGSRWIDRFGLESPQPLLDIVGDHENVRAVVWGHVHQVFESGHSNARLLACPSTAVNSLPSSPRFDKDPSGPACRWLQLFPNGAIKTGLLKAD